MPSRALSSRMSAMPSMRFSRTSSAMRSDQPGLVDLVGDLGDDDGFLVALAGLDLGPGAHDHRAAPGAVGLADARPAADEAGGREVGARDALQQALQPLVGREVRVLQQEDEPVHHLAQVVGRDLGGHAHRDALRAVDQQVGEDGGQDRRLRRAVVVGGDGSRRCPSRCPPSSRPRPASGGPRCSAWPRAGRRRRSRSCPARPPAARACSSPGPCARGCRRWRPRRGGGSCPSPRPRPWRSCGRAAPAAGPSAACRRARAGSRASGRRARRAGRGR